MIMEDYKSSEMLRDFQKQSTKEIEMKSNVAILVEATNFETFGVRQVISRNKNKFSGLALNYRNLLKSGKSLTNIKKRMNDALLDDSYIVVTSPRHKMSTSFFSLLNLNEDGVENLKIVKFLCDNHHFHRSGLLHLSLFNKNAQRSDVSKK